MTIILADTDAYFRNRLRRRLERITGVRVVGESSNSKEATAMILNRKPDVAILNSMLDGGSGTDVLHHIRQLMVPPTIIVVTDNPSGDNKNVLSVAGADFIFEKVTEGDKISNTVRLLCVTHSHIEPLDSPFATLDE